MPIKRLPSHATTERVEDDVTFISGGQHHPLEEALGFLCGVFTKAFFTLLGESNAPDRAHLFALFFQHIFFVIIAFAHGFVIKDMLVLFRGSRPNQAFMAGGKHAAGEVWRSIRFEPCNIIEDMPATKL